MPRPAADAAAEPATWPDPFSRFFPFPADETVLAAVSGGSDSTALMVHAARRFPALCVATVDHGLRPQARFEAEQVASLAARLGRRHQTIEWHGAEADAAGVQAAAREARYRLLASAAHDRGARHVLVGHTLDDCLETFIMRKARGDGPGLASIAPATLHDGIWFVRPFLGERRARLRHLLTDAGIGWIDDPSNADQRFERVRIREDIETAPPEVCQALLRALKSARQSRYRTALEAAALIGDADWLQTGEGAQPAAIGLGHGVAIDSAPWATAVSWVIRTLAGKAHGPDATSLGRLQALALKGRQGEAYGVAALVLRKDGDRLLIDRDPRSGRRPTLAASDDWRLVPHPDLPLDDAMNRRLGRPLAPRITICDPLA